MIKNYKKEIQYGLLLILGSLLVFGSTLPFPFFIFDDASHVTRNPLVLENFNFWNFFYAWLVSKIPVTFNFWQAVAAFFGKDSATPFRFLNILFHGANSFLVYLFIRKISPLCFSQKENTQPDQFHLVAIFGSLIFLLHPIHVEVVVWVSAFKDCLASFWALLSLLFYLNSRQDSSRFIKDSALSFLFFVLGVLSKQSVLPLILIFLWLEFYLFAIPLKKIVSRFLHFFLFALIVSFFYLRELKAPATQTGILDKLLIAMDALRLSLFNILLPIDLKFDYQRTFENVSYSFSHSHLYQLGIILTGIFLYIAFISSYKKAFRAFHVSTGLFIIFISLNMGFIPFLFQNISTVADRYAYLPSVGFALCFAWLLWEGMALIKFKRLIIGLFIFILLLSAFLSFNYSRRWLKSSQLISYSLKTERFSYPSLVSMGYALENEGHPEQATAYYKKAIQLFPDNPEPYFHLFRAGISTMSELPEQKALAEYALSLINEKGFSLNLDSELDLAEYFLQRKEFLFAEAQLKKIAPRLLASEESARNIRASLLKDKIQRAQVEETYLAFWFMGKLELERKNLKAAKSYLEEAQSLLPQGSRSGEIQKLLESFKN